MAHLDVELVAADHRVWSGEASMVSAPAADGDIGILPGHEPVLAILRSGTVRITPTGGSAPRHVTIDSGFLSVDSDKVTVVVDNAHTADGSAGPR